MPKFHDATWRYANRDSPVHRRTPRTETDARTRTSTCEWAQGSFSTNVGGAAHFGGEAAGVAVEAAPEPPFGDDLAHVAASSGERRASHWERKLALLGSKPTSLTESRLSIWQSDSSSEDERKTPSPRNGVSSPTNLFEYHSIWDPTHISTCSSSASSSSASSERSTPSPEAFQPLPSPPSELVRGPHTPLPLYMPSRRYTEPVLSASSGFTYGPVPVEGFAGGPVSCSPSTLEMEAAIHQLGKEITNTLIVTPPTSPQIHPLQPAATTYHQQQPAPTPTPAYQPAPPTTVQEPQKEAQLANLPIVQRDPKISDFEWGLILHMCNILWKNGWISVGRMGSFLHTATQNHDLPKVFKQRYGGLKKFVALFPDIFDLGDDHPFNPSLFMKACPQELLSSATNSAAGALPGAAGAVFGADGAICGAAGTRQTVGGVLGDRSVCDGNSVLLNQSDDIGMSEDELVEIMLEVLKSNTSVSVGRMGTTIVSKTQNHRLPRYFKSKYGGLKRFFESKSDIFVLGDDHPFNPIVYLKSDVENSAMKTQTTGGSTLPLQCTTAFPEIGAKSHPKEAGKTPPPHLKIPPRPARLVYQKMYTASSQRQSSDGGAAQQQQQREYQARVRSNTTGARAGAGVRAGVRAGAGVQKMFVPKQKIQSAPILTSGQVKNSSFGTFAHYTGTTSTNPTQTLKRDTHERLYRSNSQPVSPVTVSHCGSSAFKN